MNSRPYLTRMDAMTTELNEVEARVLGCLIEKSLTTPELYPLTLNSLVNACNQKSSREPVLQLEESVVAAGLHSLIEKTLAGRLHEPGSRVPKFMHHAEILLGGTDDKAIGTLCVLLLRGPQTPGEIKTRTDRLCKFESTAEVETLLQEIALKPEPWVVKLPRQAGHKESRWRQLFTPGAAGVPAAATPLASAAPLPSAAPAAAVAGIPQAVPHAPSRLDELEKRVAALEAAVAKISTPAP